MPKTLSAEICKALATNWPMEQGVSVSFAPADKMMILVEATCFHGKAAMSIIDTSLDKCMVEAVVQNAADDMRERYFRNLRIGENWMLNG